MRESNETFSFLGDTRQPQFGISWTSPRQDGVLTFSLKRLQICEENQFVSGTPEFYHVCQACFFPLLKPIIVISPRNEARPKSKNLHKLGWTAENESTRNCLRCSVDNEI